MTNLKFSTSFTSASFIRASAGGFDVFRRLQSGDADITGSVTNLFAWDENVYALNADLLYVMNTDRRAVESKLDLRGAPHDPVDP